MNFLIEATPVIFDDVIWRGVENGTFGFMFIKNGLLVCGRESGETRWYRDLHVVIATRCCESDSKPTKVRMVFYSYASN